MFVRLFLLVLSWLLVAVPGVEGALPVRVVTTLEVFADLIANVGGPRVEVTPLVPRGGDPHTFEPSPREARAVAQGDLFFYNGLNLEPWVLSLVENIGEGRVPAVILSAGLEPLPLEGHGGSDPHCWLDVHKAIHYVEIIRDSLIAVDPGGIDEYRARSESYITGLRELDRWMKEQIGAIPPERRLLLTYHAGFAYLAQAYGLEIAGYLVLDPDREPAAKDLVAFVQLIRERSIPAVFIEPQMNPKLVETLAKETKVKVVTLYSGAFTEEVDSYVAMMEANTYGLLEGLL
ncbi:MAG: metal ABC transporter substrate-binding protein [Limnochordia bacterium]|jgi:manganese/iron transport system substrate-binding protein